MKEIQATYALNDEIRRITPRVRKAIHMAKNIRHSSFCSLMLHMQPTYHLTPLTESQKEL